MGPHSTATAELTVRHRPITESDAFILNTYDPREMVRLQETSARRDLTDKRVVDLLMKESPPDAPPIPRRTVEKIVEIWRDVVYREERGYCHYVASSSA